MIKSHILVKKKLMNNIKRIILILLKINLYKKLGKINKLMEILLIKI